MLIDYAVDGCRATEVNRMQERFRHLPAQWQEVLIRYYVYGESKTKVCSKMGLSEAEFLSIKSESKTRLTAIS